jgi:hypothetical protein
VFRREGREGERKEGDRDMFYLERGVCKKSDPDP